MDWTTCTLPPEELDYLVGPGIETRGEVGEVKRELGKIGIFLEGFDITVTGVYTRPRPIGFDFKCRKSSELLAVARARAGIGLDNQRTVAGRFVALVAHGNSFRQPGRGRSLHLIIRLNGCCQAHLDTHGLTMRGDADGNEYDPNAALEHGYYDLLPDVLPGLFGAIGQRGVIGPWAGPTRGVDGRVNWIIFGLHATW